MHTYVHTVIFITVLTPILSSCAPLDPIGGNELLHDAPTSGFNRVSDYFSVDITGGVISARAIRFFHHPDGKDQRALIGAALFPSMASRQNVYGISEDGKKLLYFDDERLKDGGFKEGPMEAKLYLFTHEKGKELIYPYANNRMYISEQLSRNAIVFLKEQPIKSQPTWIRTTEGQEYEWKYKLRTPTEPIRTEKDAGSGAVSCDDILRVHISDAHPAIKWSGRPVLSPDEVRHCLHKLSDPDVDTATVGVVDYLSGGKYVFIKECEEERDGAKVILRLFEKKDKGWFGPKDIDGYSYTNYIAVASYPRKKEGLYHHVLLERKSSIEKIDSCKK